MSMTEPLVSILVPVYNAGDYLRPAVQSVLYQTYSNLEILIIDDGSTDGCIDSISDLSDPRMHIIRQANSGKATALNRAIDLITGEFYAIQDADDVSYPQRIERQLQCMLKNPELAAVFTGYDIILNGRRMAPQFAAKSIEECKADIERFRMPTHDPNGMFRVCKVKGLYYEPTLKIGQGLDYILQVGEIHPIMVLGECLYSYRVNLSSHSRLDPARSCLMIRKAIERACQRRGLDPAKYVLYWETTKFSHRHREAVVPHFMESVLDLRRAGRVWESLKTATACLWLHPLDPYYYKPLCYFAAPLSIVKWYRKTKARSNKS